MGNIEQCQFCPEPALTDEEGPSYWADAGFMCARCAVESAREERDQARQQLRGAVEALHKYGGHKWTCAALASTQGRKVPCDCGWSDVLATLGGQ